MAHLLSGEALSQKILNNLKKQKGRKKLSLAVVQIGKNLVSEKYIGEKEKAAKELGIGFALFHFPPSISQQKLEDAVSRIARDKTVSGMIVQLPLPKHLHTQRILDYIPPKKDVDVLSSHALGRFALGQLNILPPTVGAIGLLLEKARAKLQGRNVVVVGAGRLVGLPLTFWLLQQGATVSVANKFTENLSALTQTADILISAAGQAGLIKGDMVKKGAVVIDAGTSVEGGPSTIRQAHGGEPSRTTSLRVKKMQGDVDFESVSKKASFITPVPGGVGPLTVVCLLENLVSLAEH